MITLSITPEKFTEIKASLETNTAILAKTETDATNGTFSTSQVELSYHYDGVANLELTVLAKHGLAKFASESLIQSHIETLLDEQV